MNVVKYRRLGPVMLAFCFAGTENYNIEVREVPYELQKRQSCKMLQAWTKECVV